MQFFSLLIILLIFFCLTPTPPPPYQIVYIFSKELLRIAYPALFTLFLLLIPEIILLYPPLL